MPQTLFDLQIPTNNEPKQDINITTTILYYSEQELKEFKRLCKVGIKRLFGDLAQTKGNTADLLLNLLKEKYGNL